MVTANYRLVSGGRVFDSDRALALLFIPDGSLDETGGSGAGCRSRDGFGPGGRRARGPRRRDEGPRVVRRRPVRRGAGDLRQALRRDAEPIYLRNIGRCQQKLKQPDKAIDAFHDYLIKGGKKISADEKAEINGYIKEMEALRDEQASKQQAPPPPARSRPSPGPADRRAQPEGPPPGYTAQPAGAYPGTRAAGVSAGGRSQQPSGRWWRSRRNRSRRLPGRSTPSGGSGRCRCRGGRRGGHGRRPQRRDEQARLPRRSDCLGP